VKVEAAVAHEPSVDIEMFVRGVVVGDQMDIQPRRNVAVEVIKKREKFLMAMTRLALGDDRTIEHVERGEQCGGASMRSRVARFAA